MTWKHFGFDCMVNAWRWTLHKHAGRRLWCGRATIGGTLTGKQKRELDKLNDGTMAGYDRCLARYAELAGGPELKDLVDCDGTDIPDFDSRALEAWRAAPEGVRFKAMRLAMETQCGPPGLPPAVNQDTLAFRQVNTLYPLEDGYPNGVTGDWDADETAEALRLFDATMTALLGACNAWAAGLRITRQDWQTILRAEPTIQYTGRPDEPPASDDFEGLEFAYKPAALLQANHWPVIIREAAKAACASFQTFLQFSRAGSAWGFSAQLRTCGHPGCGDFFVGDKRTARCIWHTTSHPRGKAGSDRTSRARRKREWDCTKGDRDARADLLGRWHNVKAGNAKIRNWLRRRFSRGVTGATASFDLYLKHRADLP